ncbi:MAG TPA: tetratricopeptide repeat protein [Thermoanaerobaculia bacterium]|jgi:DNA-binding winged helix-turn-helix (wHTH) protein/TolB-like protein/tetratricopeptide (TPR) repeat protein
MAPGAYQFGPFQFDAGKRLLYRGADPVPLTPKAAETLHHLLLSHGTLIEKSELVRLVWPDTFVEEATLAQNVFTLRKALGDDGETFIETVPKRGYRFIGSVIPLAESQPAERVRHPLRIAALIAVVAIGITAWGTWWRLSGTPRDVPSIAVLPFRPIGDDQDEYLGAAMADALISRLSNIRGVVVRPTSAVRKFTNSTDPIAAGHELVVHSVLEGTIQRAGDTMRVTVQLVDVERDAPLWSDKFDIHVSDVFTLQDRISDQVARALVANLSGHARRYTENEDAHRDYLRGRYFWNKRTADGYAHAIESFQSAIRKDPSYALAYAGLADSYALLGSMTNRLMPRSVALPKAQSAANRALEIDGTIAEAHASLGFIKMHYQWDWDGGEREFRRAIELNPGYATAHHWYAYELVALRRFDEAIHEIREAQKADPVSIIVNTDVADILVYERHYDEAIAQCRRTLELDPNFPLMYWVLDRAYQGKAMYADAIAAARKGLELDPDRPDLLVDVASACLRSGQFAEANRALEEWKRRTTNRYDTFYGGLCFSILTGNRDEAFANLERQYREHSGTLILLNVDPVFDSLHGDPRFRDLVHRVGLDRAHG